MTIGNTSLQDAVNREQDNAASSTFKNKRELKSLNKMALSTAAEVDWEQRDGTPGE